MASKQTSDTWAASMPPRLKLAALAIADQCDAAGRWAGTIAGICRATGQSERTTQAALAELEQHGALARDHHAGKTTVYTYTPARFAPLPPQLSHPTPAESTPLALTARPINGHKKELEGRFAEFWTAYPRKVGKPKALAAYMSLQPDQATHHKMLRDLLERSRTADWLKDGGAFIPHPTTYLNQRRFDDEPTDPQAPQRFLNSLPEH